MKRALAILVIAAATVPAVAPRAAYAQPADARARKLLEAGERFFADLEYTKAIKVLLPVTRDPAASRAQRVRAWELVALSRFILGDRGGARTAFERVLEADPGFQLRDTSGSPRIREFFDEVRADVLGAATTADVDLEHAAPRAGTAGTRLELEVRATRGAATVTEVVVLHRKVGVLAYDTTPARNVADDRWRAGVRLDAAKRAYTIEYYVEARGAAGAVLARIATPDAPLVLEIAPGGEARPWFGRWYVIAGAAAVAAGATGAVILSTRGPGNGSLPPGSVTVTP